ncbi:Thioredoxin-2 [Eumeta japonica]|uniref:Thioredoxin-2 n=1 Tax=Eumeta variegata TaxID=151549 RepID=A0A4C1UUG9_EUMVA|nr:Thioredoxin-2 [Eumeta japonica]
MGRRYYENCGEKLDNYCSKQAQLEEDGGGFYPNRGHTIMLTFNIIPTKTSKKMSIHIKDSEDLKTRLSEAGEKLVVIDFMATWCGPCKMIGPKLEEMAAEMADSIVVLKVDVDECEDIAAEYDVNSMPTFVFLKQGKKVEEFSGANAEKLRVTILKHK